MSQVQPVALSDALKVSLNNYYDLLKTQLGGLATDEYLQLKLVADPVDIDDTKYRYWSQYNLLTRSDLSIDPVPVSGTIMTSADELSRVYGRFLQRLRSYAVKRDLTPEQQAALDDLDLRIERDKEKADDYYDRDTQAWKRYCDRTGKSPGDQSAYIQWSINSGYSREITELFRDLRGLYFDRTTITDRQYADPEDRDIVDAEFDYDSLQMRLRYPIHPVYEYSNASQFSLEYLATLPEGSSALYDDRRAITWNVSLPVMKSTGAGSFAAHFDHSTGDSSSITTDWSYSGSVSYFVVSVDASASEHTKIEEEFKTSTAIDLSAKAAFKVQIVYPGWFRSDLFRHKGVKENIRDFQDFFGPNGTLRYYPTYLILVRGFSSSFENSQNWTYDYEHKFDASAGGGFSVVGIRFGSSATYGSHVTKHKIEKSGTTLTFSDGEDTLRFVGYVVKENTVWHNVVRFSPIDEVGNAIKQSGYHFKKGGL